MYIPIGPSKKQLYKIVILLLLLCYLLFLGMCKPKAENMSNYFNTTGFTDTNWYWNKYSIGIASNSNIYYDLQHNIANIPQGTKTFNFNAYVANHFDTTHYSCESSQNGVCQIYYDTNSFLSMSFSYQYQYCSMSVMATSNNGYLYNVSCPVNNWYDGFLRFNVTNHGQENMSIDFGVGIYVGFDISDNSVIANNTGDIANNSNDIKNSINDSSIDNSSANDLTSNSAFQDSNGLDSIIKAPLNFIRSLTSSTCSSISLTIPYIDAQVSLPCMSTIYTKALGQQLVNLIALVINGVVLYRYCLKILQLVHNAKNPNKDELEVLDL